MAIARPARRPHDLAMRPVPLALALAAAAAAARPAPARADDHAIALGGSLGAYRWPGEACPYVTPCYFPMEIRHGSAGARYEGRFGGGLLREGHALTLEARAELTRSRVTDVDATAPEAALLEAHERDRARWLGAAQLAVGYDGPLVGARAGLGVVGTTRVAGDRLESRYLQGDEVRIPVPNFDLRLGPRARGPSLRLGVGLVPLVGAGRWYALYALARHAFGGGVEVSAGGAWVVLEQTDGHAAALLAASAPVGPLRVGAFAMIDPWTPRALVDGATYGASLELRLDAAPTMPPLRAPIGRTPY